LVGDSFDKRIIGRFGESFIELEGYAFLDDASEVGVGSCEMFYSVGKIERESIHGGNTITQVL